MKKKIVLLLAAVMAVGMLSGCGKKGNALIVRGCT